jgi:hypothetical protein
MKKVIIILFFSVFIPFKMVSQSEEKTSNPKFLLTVGTAYTFQYHNNIQQPSDKGTALRLDNYKLDSPLALRFQLDYKATETTTYRFLISPFVTKSTFIASDKIIAKDKTFEKGEEIKSRFGFSSVRFGFFNKITEGFFTDFKIGATVIARKWEIILESVTQKSENDNFLILPLLYVGYEKNITPKVSFTSDLDVLYFPFAYALEGGSALNYDLHKNFQIGLQYRIISGTFKSDEIKNEFTSQNVGIALRTRF